MSSHRLVLGSALTSLLLSVSVNVLAQTDPTTISDGQTTPIDTATNGDIILDSSASVDVGSGVNVTINSSNNVTHNGIIRNQGDDNVTGVLIEGGNTGSYTQTGTITLIDNTAAQDSNNDGLIDLPFADGENKTGILISGASPFTGNVTIEDSAGISVEGNDSFGIRLMNAASLNGNLSNAGSLNLTGNNNTGIQLGGVLDGDFNNSGSITSRGENSRAIHAMDNITGSFQTSGTITNTAYTSTTRLSSFRRDDLTDSDRLQAGPAIEINGDVDGGVSISGNISQFAAAPAVLVDGSTPITIGVFNDFATGSVEQYGFVTQGTITSSGIHNDVPATAIELNDVTIANGIFNSATLTATTFRSGDNGVADTTDFDGHARVYHLSGNVTTDSLVNTGTLTAVASEASDEIFSDRDNITAPRLVSATTIDISSDSAVTNLTNSGTINAGTSARNAEATAIIDRSGNLNTIENTGIIQAVNSNSDATGAESVTATTTALDLSANTSGVTITQSQSTAADAPTPTILGDILLGSGADNLTSSAGTLTGALSFGAGADIFDLTGTAYSGVLSDSDGDLAITAVNSSITHTGTDDINIRSASFDAGSSFSTVIDPNAGDVGTLSATDTISFEDGANVNFTLSNVAPVSYTHLTLPTILLV